MKFTSNVQVLNQAISRVVLAVSQRSTEPALEGIHIITSINSVCFTGFNTELCITETIDATNTEKGEIVVPAKFFTDIVRKCKNDNITIETDDKLLIHITSGNSEYTLVGIDALQFPEMPQVEQLEKITIEQKSFCQLISQVLFAVATTDDKPVYTGVLFDYSNDKLTMVAMDGFRLAMCKCNAEATSNVHFIVPAKTLSELLKLIKPEDIEMEIVISSQHILINVMETTVISRLIEGDFIDYKSAIPKDTNLKVIVNRQEFISSIDRTSLLINDKLKNPLKLSFEENSVKISCTTTIGKAYDECNCKTEGESIRIGFNNKFLIDALRNTDTDEVRLELSGTLAPMRVLPPNGDDYLFLVLPMRLKDDN